MSRDFLLPLAALLVILCGCGSNGNLAKDNGYRGSSQPPVAEKFFDPFAKPGSNPVIWAAPTWDRNGTIVAPRDPSLQWDWEPYETAPWRHPGQGPGAPEGTF
jgi:hypothetical protein